MFQNVRLFLFTAITLAAGVLVPAGFAPAFAQDIVPEANRGVPQDWSHRHVVIRDAETMKDAGGKGAVAFHRWKERLKDPRFTMAVARRTIEVQPTANKMYSGRQLAFFDRFKRQPKDSSLTRDWNVALGNATALTDSGTGTGVGTAGMFPAKYTWDLNATPSCTNDFIVYTTGTPGRTSGTSARQIGTFVAFTDTTFGNVNSGNATLTITNGGSSITLRASTTASPTSNTGLNFYMGDAAASNSPAYYAYNLAAAINRNGQAVGVQATSAGGVVTIIANTAGTGGNSITIQKSASLPDTLFDLGGSSGTTATNLAGGAAGGVQPTLVAYNQLYKGAAPACNATQATAGSPNIYWSYNTGTGSVAELSPALSLDGSQVAFVQRSAALSTTSSTSLSAGQIASLVLLKWAPGSANTHAATVAPTVVTNANYRSCTAPCMTTFSLGANNQNSSPYVDYANDVIYVGDAYGRLHKFTGVFGGTPAAAGGAWPVTLSTGNMLSSPVFDSASNQVFVGSDVSERVDDTDTGTGGLFYRVAADGNTVVSSGQITAYRNNVSNENVKMTGVRDGAIVDSLAQRVYVFVESDTTTVCGDVTTCKAVYQFPVNFSAASTGTAQQIGRGQIPGRTLPIGQFDDAYWSSSATSPTGSIYACGSVDGGNSRAPTLWRIPITNNIMGAATSLMTLTSAPDIGEVGATCSPVTLIKNGANEYLYAGVSANGNTTGCTGACIYMIKLQGASPNSNTTSTPAVAVDTNNRFISVSTATAVSTTEAPVLTTRTGAAWFSGMTITQSATNPNNRPISYWLRKNGADTGITCTVEEFESTCTASGSVAYAAGDTISVRLNRSGTGTSAAMTFQVQLTGSGSNLTTPAAGFGAPGGTSGIVVDNVSTQAGASQIYYSTLARPGRAVQATQAGLQ